MNTIDNYQSISSLYTQSTSKVSNTQKLSNDDNKVSTEDFFKYKIDNVEISKRNEEEKKNEKLDSMLESIVAAGTISVEQKNAIQSAFQQAKQNNITVGGTYTNKPVSPLDNLVKNGTITEEQKKSIKNAISASIKGSKPPQGPPPGPPPGSPPSDDTNVLKTTLDSLLESGTITEDQETSINSALEAMIKAVTESSESDTTDSTDDPLDTLVKAGKITEDQKDEIKNKLEASKIGRMPPSGPPPGGMKTSNEDEEDTANTLDTLVKAGTITEEQENTIKTTLDAMFKEIAQGNSNRNTYQREETLTTSEAV